MKNLIDLALNNLNSLGVSYGDVRIVDDKGEYIVVKNGVVEALEMSQSLGFGIRVLVNGAWGFASSNNLSKGRINEIAKKAYLVAKASGQVKTKDIGLSKSSKIIDSYRTPFKKDPFSASIDKKIDYLLEVDNLIRKTKGVSLSKTFFRTGRKNTLFGSTEGSFVDQEITECGGGLESIVTKDNEVQIRSFPKSNGQFATGGYEIFESLKLKENAQKIAEESAALIFAPQCPNKKTNLILDGNQLALQVHESCGHPIELDRVLGMEASYAGTSFLTLEKFKKFKYGSGVVNITADATYPGGLGTFGYDDEGIPAQRFPIIKNGLFVNYLTSRETAGVLGQKSNGTMRADGWDRMPLIRMTNINLESGKWDFKDLIADTKDGIFMSTNHEWSIDDKRLNFQFGCEIAWEIKNGRLGRMLKNPNYHGVTPKFWSSCDAICNKKHWQMWGTPNCGKGQPSQIAHVGHGTAPSRFRNIEVGIGKWK